jgi:hypothetical protein
MIATRSMLLAVSVSMSVIAATPSGAAVREPEPEEVPAGREPAGFTDAPSVATREVGIEAGESPSIRGAAEATTDPGREIDALSFREDPNTSGPQGLKHVGWSGDHLVIGAGTLIVILLVLVLVT